jgi:hypothetical protein
MKRRLVIEDQTDSPVPHVCVRVGGQKNHLDIYKYIKY